jgi:decaprenyl-phosphate phosphoribosyltransferase
MPTLRGSARLRGDGPPLAAAPNLNGLRAAIITVRPRQWTKNALVIAAAGAAGALGHDDVPVRVGFACVAFCLLASGIYAINDVRDADEDRQHPRKRHRPVAAGELRPRAATALGIALLLLGLLTCAFVRPPLAGVGAAYVVLTLSYTLVWRHLLLFDLLAIAGGFVLRALAGGVAAPVMLSRWFVLVVSCAAVFVAAGKRQSERHRAEATGTRGGRRVLELYSVGRLRLLLAVSGAGALFAYCIWAFELPTVHGVPWRPLTIVPFAAALLRFAAVVRAGEGEAPEDLLTGDRWLMLAGVAWVVLFALSVHAAG